MKKFVWSSLLGVVLVSSVYANTDNRNWVMADGTKMNANLVKFDKEKDLVVLQKGDDGPELEYKREDFSVIDQAWLVEWAQFSMELEEKMKDVKGTFEHYQAQGKYTTDFYVYYPSSFTPEEGWKPVYPDENGEYPEKKADDPEIKRLPMFIMFHPGGKGVRYNRRFMDAAEKVGVIIVTVDTFKNTRSDEVEADLLKRFKELLPMIEEAVPHDQQKLFMGGTSGGGMAAFGYSVDVKRPWAGIFSNGGWLGGPKYYDRKYPAGMRIAMVNGNNDRAANAWVKPDGKVLTKNGSEVALFSFEGGHQVPPPMTQAKSFLWLIGEVD